VRRGMVQRSVGSRVNVERWAMKSRKRTGRMRAIPAHAQPPPPIRTPPVLAAVVCVYVVVLGAMVAFDRYVFLVKGLILPVLLLAALVSGRGKRFVNDWAVYLAAVVFLEFCRGLTCAVTTHFELPMYVDYVLRWERGLCGGAIAPVSLQHLRAALADPRWLDRFFVLVYSSHYLFFLLFGFVLWYKQRDAFRTYTIAIPAVIAGGLVGCALAPTVPPWMAANDFLVLPPIVQIVRSFYNVHLPVLVAVFDVNPIAAMPSVHAALPAICGLLALRYFGRRGLPVVAYALVVCLAVVYLGEHFLVDVVAGWVLALVVYGAVAYWEGASAARHSLPEPHERWALRPIAIALLLVAAAVGVGQISAHWFGPLPITRAFVERELMGRSPLARYFLGRIAYDAGDFAEAQAEFTGALQDLPSPAQQQVIRTLLGRSTARARQYARPRAQD
jgi:membrane-associated phospholipid phosphatase